MDKRGKKIAVGTATFATIFGTWYTIKKYRKRDELTDEEQGALDAEIKEVLKDRKVKRERMRILRAVKALPPEERMSGLRILTRRLVQEIFRRRADDEDQSEPAQ